MFFAVGLYLLTGSVSFSVLECSPFVRASRRLSASLYTYSSDLARHSGKLLITQIIRTSTINTDRGNLYWATTKFSQDKLHSTAESCSPPGQMPQISSEKSREQSARNVLWCHKDWDCDCTYLSEPCRLDLSPKAEQMRSDSSLLMFPKLES